MKDVDFIDLYILPQNSDKDLKAIERYCRIQGLLAGIIIGIIIGVAIVYIHIERLKPRHENQTKTRVEQRTD
jgi:hypothetical protein